MKKFSTVIAATTFLVSSMAFAHDSDSMTPSCLTIVKACKAAGFERKSEDKRFWQDCMQPVLLGKSVKGVDVKADDVKACREQKITKIQQELKALQDVQ